MSNTSQQKPMHVNKFPVSAFQQGVYHAYMFYQEKHQFNVPLGFKATGPLVIDHLKQAFLQLGTRHELLSSCFLKDKHEVFRQLLPRPCLTFTHVDLQKDPTAAQQLAKILAQEDRHIFDLASGALARLVVVSLPGEQHILLFNMHHIVMDGYTYSLLLREISTTYTALVAGQVVALPPAPQFQDFLNWQTENLEKGYWDNQLAYWEAQYAGVKHPFSFAKEHRLAQPTDAAGNVLVRIVTGELVTAIHTAAKKAHVTTFQWMLTAFAAYLSIYKEVYTLQIGSPVANRCLRQHKQMVGPLLNFLPFCLSYDPRATFEACLQKTSAHVHAAFRHAKIPTAQLLQQLLRKGYEAINLYNIVFVYHQSPYNDLDLGTDIEVDLFSRQPDVATNELSLMVEEHNANKLIFEYAYATHSSDTPAMEQFIAGFEAFLEKAAATPQQTILSLGKYPTYDMPHFMKQYNDTAAAVNTTDLPYDILTTVAQNLPHKVVLCNAHQQLSYAQLINVVTHVSARLQAHLPPPHATTRQPRVAILLDRSIEAGVAMLAALQLKVTYIPIHYQWPEERLRNCLLPLSPDLIITTPEKAALLRQLGYTDRPILHIETTDLSDQAIDQVLPTILPYTHGVSDKMYIMFTSGSTGLPKGVGISYLNFLNFIWSMHHWLKPSAKDRWMALASFSFDIFQLEFLMPLLTGGTCYLPTADLVMEPHLLTNALKDFSPTLLQATPAFWQLLFDSGLEEWLREPAHSSLHTVLAGGEPLPVLLRNQLLQLVGPKGRAFNVYGPTETTIWSTIAPLQSTEPVHIGVPLANTTLYVRNAAGKLAAAEEIGELYIGGLGVGLGYEGDPNNPDFTLAQGLQGKAVRCYATGDLAYFTKTGHLVLNGRKDSQVKLRGHRISLKEIEAQLLRHPHIKQAAVVLLKETAPLQTLVGFYTLKMTAADPGEAALKQHLATALPPYMVPLRMLCCEAFPQTGHGKIDRAALALWQLPPPSPVAALQQGDALENLCITLWQDLLKVQRVGLHDAFIDLGGHSLMAVRFVGLLNELLGTDITPGEMLRHQTIANLISAIKAKTENYAALLHASHELATL